MGINSRFEGLKMDLNSYAFHICGCGAIGSSAAIQLARMGVIKFVLYDMDLVEDVNIGVSQYDNRHIGAPKVTALSSIWMQWKLLILIVLNIIGKNLCL